MKELMEIANALQRLGSKPGALATIINVEGPAYRQPGARMLITKGNSWGMVSGGDLESDVIKHARQVMKTGRSQIRRYDSHSNDYVVFGTGFSCKSLIDVFIEPVTLEAKEYFIRTVKHCSKTRQPGALATLVKNENELTPGIEHACFTDGFWEGSENLAATLNSQSVGADQTTLTKQYGATDIFIQQFLPPVHLIIFGGCSDVIPLIRLGKEVGFHVTVVDSGQRLSSRRWFHEADYILLCSAHEALSLLELDDRTVAVVMNHHFERDLETLEALAYYPLSYIGTLGPKRRLARLLNSLKQAGIYIPNEFENNLHGPSGLDIGAKTPEEIAVSIMAEILSVLNENNARRIHQPEHSMTMAW